MSPTSKSSLAFVTCLVLPVLVSSTGPGRAAPTSRFDTALRGDLSTTGNTLGLAGLNGAPSTNDGIGAFIDGTGTLQAPGWPLGTTLDWTLASSSAVLDLPDGATILKAELVWGGTLSAAVLGFVDAPVQLSTPSGLLHEVAPAAASASPANGTMATAGYYGRSADVTALVEGAGTYRVGRVPSSLSGSDAAAGWTLYVFYSTPSSTPKRLSLSTVMEQTDAAANSDITVELAGLCIPSSAGERTGRLSLSAMDGDANITGETLRWARQTSQLGDNGSRVAPPGATVTNPLISRIGANDGTLDTRGSFGLANHTTSSNVSGARQGWDLTNIDTTTTLATNWASAFVRPTAGSDVHALLAVAIAIRHRTPILVDEGPVVSVQPTQATLGTVLTVTVTLQNTGDASAANGVFTLPLPAGVVYVPSSFLFNGAFPTGGAVTSPTALTTGVTLPTIGDSQTAIVTLSLRVDTVPTAGLTLAPRVVYENQACPGTLVADVFDPAPISPVTFTVCGNGRLELGEACDDGNAAALDGCSATCQVEAGWDCGPNPGAMGTALAPDSRCGATCGDGRIAVGAELCDDGDLEPLDGCDASCEVEYGYTCAGAPGGLSACTSLCGDGRLALGAEGCDDGGRDPLDGCDADCGVEPGWTCVARPPEPGNPGSPANPDSTCVSECGDGLLALGAEACDDGNTLDLDGCSAACEIERGYACQGLACAPIACGDGLLAVGSEQCDDGNTVSGDGCDAACRIEIGYGCEHTAIGGDDSPDSTCSTTCGDGVRAASEICDDGDLVVGDGCDADCLEEVGWTCVGPVGGLSVCSPICGDGLILGGEVCDDGNVEPAVGSGEDPDGCLADCAGVDFGWDCEGEPSVCTTTCGDGLIGANVEVCDDGNTVAGDGCAADCAEVERGWSCGDPPASPSVCEPLCGDGIVRGVEGCDDGDNDDGDGCSADCRVEEGWVCDEVDAESPSSCFFDGDGDGVLDDGDRSGVVGDNPCPVGVTEGCDDNCPEFANPDQTFPERPHPLCPPYRGPRTQGGGGGCAGGDAGRPGGFAGALVGLGLGALLGAYRRRRRGGATVGAIAAVVVGSAMGGAAREVKAQEVDPRSFDASLAPSGVLAVDGTATNGHLRPFASLIGSLANDELITRVASDTTERGPLRSRFIMTLAAGLGLFDRLELAVGVPLVSTSSSPGGLDIGSGEASEAATGLGDLRLVVRGRLLGPARFDEGGFGLGLALEATLPTSSGDFMGERAASVMPRLLADYRDGAGLTVALNLGYRARNAVAVDDLVIDDELRFGLGAEVPVGAFGLALMAEVNAGLGLGESEWDEGGIASREVQVEGLGGLRWRSRAGWVLSAAAGSGISQGYGAADFRVVLGLTWNAAVASPIEEPLVSAALNERKDRWTDDEPVALALGPPPGESGPVPAEVFDAIVLADDDTDADGILIPADKCPDEPEDFDGFQDEDGCPDPDNDGDGILDADDKCPNEKEVFNGFEDEDGCPDEGEAMVTTKGDQLLIADRIRFKSGSAELLPTDKVILDSVAAVLKAAGAIGRLRIEGHTDNLGDREFNVDLAERRAWAVRSYLIEQGVDGDRLFAKGFGPTRPVASNATEAGRAQNRRVEFHMVKPGEPVEGIIR